MGEQLKPCPFCGGEAELCSTRLSEDCMGAYVACTSCHTQTDMMEDAYAPFEDAVSAWNRRTLNPALQQVVEALEPFARYAEVLLHRFPRNDGWGLDIGTEHEAVVNREDFARLLSALSAFRKGEGGS